jgi:hypothetical protein
MKRLILIFVLFVITLSITYPYFCKPKDRKAKYCAEEYLGVCGHFDSTHVRCTRLPCGTTYSNKCSACKNPDVTYVTLGECDNIAV